jgi:hypothetical protein
VSLVAYWAKWDIRISDFDWASTLQESGVAKTDVARFAKIFPAYKACSKCTDFINEGKSFLGRGNAYLRLSVSPPFTGKS